MYLFPRALVVSDENDSSVNMRDRKFIIQRGLKFPSTSNLDIG